MLDFFPPHQHGQARSMIAGTIKGVISQRLVPGADGGRVAVCEILRMTGRVRDMIIDPSQTGKLMEVIASGSYYGMQTFDQALFGHVKAGRVTFEDAMQRGVEPVGLQAADAGRRAQGDDDGGRGRRARSAARRTPTPPPTDPPLPRRSAQRPARATLGWSPSPAHCDCTLGGGVTSFGKVTG